MTFADLHFTYDVDGSLISMNHNGNEYFYITNLQGDVIKLVDINGDTVANYTYDAWGNITTQYGTLADINPYRYRGYRWDEETGYYYLNSRYYNPQIGRFISADGVTGPEGIILGHNNYAYANNNSINYVDKDGEWAHWVGGTIVGAAVGATIQVAMNLKNGEDWHANLGGAVLGGAVGGFLTASGASALSVGMGTGALTGLGNQIDDVFPNYSISNMDRSKWDTKEMAIDAVTSGVLAGVGSSLGSKAVGYSSKQVKAWFKPQSLKSFATKGFGRKVSAMISIGNIPSAVSSATNLNMNKAEFNVTDYYQHYLRKRLE